MLLLCVFDVDVIVFLARLVKYSSLRTAKMEYIQSGITLEYSVDRENKAIDSIMVKYGRWSCTSKLDDDDDSNNRTNTPIGKRKCACCMKC